MKWINPVQTPDMDIQAVNFQRVKKLLPVLAGMSLIMFGLAFAIHDDLSVRIINSVLLGLFLLLSLVIYLVDRPEKIPERAYRQILIDGFALVGLFWGTALVGYNPNAIVPYFDFLISVFIVPLVILLPDRKILAYLGLVLAYLLFATPVLRTVETNRVLFLISVILFLTVSFAASRLFYHQYLTNLDLTNRLFHQQHHLSELVDVQSKALVDAEDKMSREVIRILAKVLDDYDPYTRGHSENVARLSENLARRLGYPEKFQHEIFWVGMIHDIGKIRIPKYILNKPDRLTAEEFDKIRQHPLYGYDMISESEVLRPLADIVLCHHEHYDGSGYPNHLSGDQIPLAAQILTIADAWDAMLSRRVYRESMSEDYARTELVRCSGKQFAPFLVNSFLAMMEEQEPSGLVQTGQMAADWTQTGSLAKLPE
ncbi:MAG: HD-GYP domain-containing protein [Clostridia bacterium]|nr:HD-GYP domain-containing protein [Clostridia bacterium]NCC76488.1 HD-GYP domain-containing protein [Clostridia bacterium]